VTVTALAPTALEAETLAKAALLSGPRTGGELLVEHGGVLVHDDGDVELVGPLAPAGRSAA
jgi:thiamine biosynthesis lipoprotein